MKKAEWICAGKDIGTVSPRFSKTLKFKKGVKKAKLCVSAMGLYSAFLDGKRIGEGVLTPGFTSYNNRIQYQTYDITDMIKGKSAELSIVAGKGWAIGIIGWKNNNHVYADHPSVTAWIDVIYNDGEKEHFSTDDTWSVHTTEILDSEIYNGETVDKTAEIKSVGKAKIDRSVKTKLVPQVGEDIIEQERVAPMELIITPKGEKVIDFGQNMVGYVEVRIKGERGSKIVMTHAEVLDTDGNFYNENYRSAESKNTYVLSGGDDVFKPTFSFQGFRYIRLDEYPFEEVDLDSFTAVAVYSNIKRTGYFSCGNEKINQLYHNVLWGQRSNYLDIPTDCPQRDERLGWTGDAQVFARTAAFNFDVKKFFTKWLGDMALDQLENGGIPGVIPNSINHHAVSSGWADSCTIVPWEMYLAYGDTKVLKDAFPMMKKFINYIRKAGRVEELWLDRWHYGDWLALEDGKPCGDSGATQRDFIASAYYARSAEILVNTGKILGEDVSEYEELLKKIKKAFHENFMENGLPCMSKIGTLREEKNHEEQPVIKAITQTSVSIALCYGLYEGEEERQKLADCLADLIHKNDDRLATGFLGTPHILHALSENGYADVAYTLLFQEKMPSWLYSVKHGATTMWERWNCIKEDGTFSNVSMTSFNHYAYGAVADWLYGDVAGIKILPDGAGYSHISIAPIPSEKLGFVNCKVDTVKGEVVSNWYYKKDHIHYEITVPNGTVAELSLPDGVKKTLHSGSYLFTTKI